MREKDTCRLCGSSSLELLLDLGSHPIAHHFLQSPTTPEYVHRVALHACKSCGLVQIVDPVPPEKLYTNYVCMSSWKRQPHIPRLLELLTRLAETGPHSKVIEIGSNDGNFLEQLRHTGVHKLLGIEPAADAREAANSKGLSTEPGYFTESLARSVAANRGCFDVAVARQVLEHVTDLTDFMRAIATIVRPGGYVLIEVPNFDFCLDAFDYSAIWEEHVNYFTLDTLTTLMTAFGIRVVHAESTVFSGEAQVVIGQLDPERSSRVRQTERHRQEERLMVFRERWPRFRTDLYTHIQSWRERSLPVVLYGAGCRSSSLVNFSGIGQLIDHVVDDQREKQGLFTPGSRLPILPGDTLETMPGGLCLLAVNAENEDIVIRRRRSFTERGGEFYSVLPPSPRLFPALRP